MTACLTLLCEPNELASLAPDTLQMLASEALAGDVGRLWVMTTEDRPGEVLGAMTSSPHPGRIAFTWPPRLAADDPQVAAELAAVFLDRVAASHMAEGANTIQCLVWDRNSTDPTPNVPAWLEIALRQSGFVHQTLLEGRRLEVGSARLEPNPAEGEPYTMSRHGDWERLVTETLQDSCDCPYLTGRRTAQDLIDSLGTSLQDRQSWWWRVVDTATRRGVGVLMLDPSGSGDALDIAYLGVSPEYRGKGWGRRLVEMAIQQTRSAGRSGLRVVVDAGNRYAVDLYERCGLVVESRALACVRLSGDGMIGSI